MDTGSHLDQDQELVAHERTYHGFSVLIRWCMLLLGTGILSLTLWFATPAGFWGAFFVGLITFALGYWFLVRHEEHQPLDVWAPGR